MARLSTLQGEIADVLADPLDDSPRHRAETRTPCSAKPPGRHSAACFLSGASKKRTSPTPPPGPRQHSLGVDTAGAEQRQAGVRHGVRQVAGDLRGLFIWQRLDAAHEHQPFPAEQAQRQARADDVLRLLVADRDLDDRVLVELRPQAGGRRVDLRPVAAGDQVGGLIDFIGDGRRGRGAGSAASRLACDRSTRSANVTCSSTARSCVRASSQTSGRASAPGG